MIINLTDILLIANMFIVGYCSPQPSITQSMLLETGEYIVLNYVGPCEYYESI